MGKVTIKDIAKVANVSYTTVSRALSGDTEISERTRERIMKISSDMGYTKNYIARSMVKKKTDLIGLVLPSIDNPFMSELAYYTEVTARRFGYNLMLCNSYPDLNQEQTAIQLLIGHQVDGVLIIPQRPESCETLKRFTSLVPTVYLSENLREHDGNYVSVDNRQGAVLGTEYLFGLGHRNILYFGRRKGSTTHLLRAEGYNAACIKLGIHPDIISFDAKSSSVELGVEMARKCLREKKDFTAVFASTDTNAIGLMQAARELGIRIPEDISLIGFDNIRISALPQINLTTVAQPKEEMAVTAVTMLMDMIGDKTLNSTHKIVPPKLIERGSCRTNK